MNITNKELAVLKAIDDSDYGDTITDSIWTFSIADNVEGVDKKSLPGVISSLNKKGLVNSNNEAYVSLNDATISMTDAGVMEYVKMVGKENISKHLD